MDTHLDKHLMTSNWQNYSVRPSDQFWSRGVESTRSQHTLTSQFMSECRPMSCSIIYAASIEKKGGNGRRSRKTGARGRIKAFVPDVTRAVYSTTTIKHKNNMKQHNNLSVPMYNEHSRGSIKSKNRAQSASLLELNSQSISTKSSQWIIQNRSR